MCICVKCLDLTRIVVCGVWCVHICLLIWSAFIDNHQSVIHNSILCMCVCRCIVSHVNITLH